MRDAVNDHQVDPAVLVIEAVHRLQDALEPVLALHADEGVGLEPRREGLALGTAGDEFEVAVKLGIGLLGVVKEHSVAGGVW